MPNLTIKNSSGQDVESYLNSTNHLSLIEKEVVKKIIVEFKKQIPEHDETLSRLVSTNQDDNDVTETITPEERHHALTPKEIEDILSKLDSLRVETVDDLTLSGCYE